MEEECTSRWEAAAWYHIAATFEPYETAHLVRLYLDGVEVTLEKTEVAPIANNQDLTIGKSQYGEYWDGILDDVRIYSRALSADEIMKIKSERLQIIKDPAPIPLPWL